MSKHKLIVILSCGLLLTGAIAGNSIINNASSVNNHSIIQNHILLSAPNLNNLAVVINTNQNPLVLYSENNYNSNISSYISVGEMLNYQATNNPNFYKVTVQETGATGYISADDMQIIESGLNKAYSTINKNGQIINVSTDVKLMSAPDVHSQILESYKNDAIINVLGKQDQWYKVNIDGQIGYMYQSYVGIDTSSNIVTTSNSSSYTGPHVDNMQTGGMPDGENIKNITINSKTITNTNNISLNQLSKLKKQNLLTLNNINEIINPISQYLTDAQRLNNSNKAYHLWNNQLNTIYIQLKDNLSGNKLKQLESSEVEWIKLKNSEDQTLANQGGSSSSVHAMQNMVHMTKLRCYQLVNDYM